MRTSFSTRRQFLAESSRRLAATTGYAAILSSLPPVTRAEAAVPSALVRFDAQIEPLVQLIEESPRDDLLPQVAARIQRGTSYREVLAALLLAGIRNVQPRPSVGFKFHCVLVVNACHLASLEGSDEDRWLPIFWALDYFKSSQSDEEQRSGWRMSAVNEDHVPPPEQARSMFVEAMESWDEAKADAATAGLVRTAGATEVFNLFARFAARDYRSIGHKAIYLANSWRTLQIIGWQHAEPVMRSLAFALLNHSGEPNPATHDLEADRAWRDNALRVERVPMEAVWGRVDAAVTEELIAEVRRGDPSTAAEVAANALSQGVSPQSLWDGVFVGAGELLMRQPGIMGLHGLTTANAMHFLWSNVADRRLRQQLLLQACAFNPHFLQSAKSRGRLGDQTVQDLAPATAVGAKPDALEAILADISSDRRAAAEKVYGYLAEGGSTRDLLAACRQMIFLKGNNAHDYKFSSAVLEDAAHLSPAWRDQFVAMSVFNLKGSGHPDNGLVERVRGLLIS